jgi:hypothetical protein
MQVRPHPITWAAIGFFAALLVFTACEMANGGPGALACDFFVDCE